ncbi:site-2 protease family protein [archaeon CG10_big_fil_rev_8_21_14_0_10_43_11]|nr:MAG: site-2 protease family protein [archaeon CG10_big_fil_rev_8_21_14_0_10_43_11]
MREFKLSKLTFTITELRDIAISVFVLGLLFSFGVNKETWNELILYYLGATFVLGVSFVLHELGHKFVAQSYGAHANYTLWWSGLLISLLVGVASGGRLIFFAPGFVLISSSLASRFGFGQTFLREEEVGKISVAGPLTNIILLFLFKLFSPVLPFELWTQMVILNAWLALFNLIPVPPLDGSKVFVWRRDIWFALATISLVSLFFAIPVSLVVFISFTIAILVAGAIFLSHYGIL